MNQLKLIGDRASCSQCFANLRSDKSVHQYYISQSGNKFRRLELNAYQSMKIDEAILVGRSDVKTKIYFVYI